MMTALTSEMVRCPRCKKSYQMDQGCSCQDVAQSKKLRFLEDSESINWNDPEGGTFPTGVFFVEKGLSTEIKRVLTIQRNGYSVSVVSLFPKKTKAGKLIKVQQLYRTEEIMVACETRTYSPKMNPRVAYV